MLAAYPSASTLVVLSSDAVCVLGLSAALQAAHVPLAPAWLVAAALSEAIKHPVQLAALGIVTPALAHAFPLLTRVRIGTVARTVMARWRTKLVSSSSSDSSVASVSSPPAPPPSPTHWAEQLANQYGAAAFVGKNVLSLVTRLALFGVVSYGAGDSVTAWMLEHHIVDSVAVKQVRASCACVRLIDGMRVHEL